MPGKDWYLGVKEKQLGPYSERRVVATVAAGKLKDSTRVWAEGMDDWLPIWDIPRFAQARPQPAAPAQATACAVAVAPRDARGSSRATRRRAPARRASSSSGRPLPASRRGFFARAVYYLFVGCWLAPLVDGVGLMLMASAALFPVGQWVLERTACLLTLRQLRWRAGTVQVSLPLRILYVVFFGWWVGYFVSVLAWALSSSLLGLGLGQDLMERRGLYFSLKQYVPVNLSVDREPTQPRDLGKPFVMAGIGVLLAIGLVVAASVMGAPLDGWANLGNSIAPVGLAGVL